MSSISINVQYIFPSDDQEEPRVVEKNFDESNCEIARIGLPEGVKAVKVIMISPVVVSSFIILFRVMCKLINLLSSLELSHKVETTLTQVCMIMDHYHLQKKEVSLQN